MKRGLFILFFLFLGVGCQIICFAETPNASQIERSQEILEKEKTLRENIEKKEKVLIKKIMVTGVTLLTTNQIKDIIMPFQNHWLSKDEIQGILDAIKLTYQQKGFANQPEKMSFEIKNCALKIKVNELTR